MSAQLIRYHRGADSPEVDDGWLDLTDYDVLPRDLTRSLHGTSCVQIDDPFSFPFEDAGSSLWEAPLLVRLPDVSPEECIDLFDRVLFRHLTVCDLLAVDDSLVDPLRLRYGYARSMFVPSDHRIDPEMLDTAARVADELRRRHSTLYTEWPLPTVAYKRRLVCVDQAIRKAVGEASVVGGRPRTELHGWHVRRFVPSAWGELTRIVERRPIALDRLALDYQPTSVGLIGSGAPVPPLGTDVGIGVDHLRQSSTTAIRRGLSLLFGSVQVGGRLVLVETFDGSLRPDDFVDILLDISTHRLVLQDLQVMACEDDAASTTAVYILTKIGERVNV